MPGDPEELGLLQRLHVGSFRSGLYVPDLAVVPDAVRGLEPVSVRPKKSAVEITSRANADQARIGKWAGYAKAGVPLYMYWSTPGHPAARPSRSATEG